MLWETTTTSEPETYKLKMEIFDRDLDHKIKHLLLAFLGKDLVSHIHMFLQIKILKTFLHHPRQLLLV